VGWADPSPLRNRVRQLVADGKTPDQVKKLLAPNEVLRPEGVFNMAIEERAKIRRTFRTVRATTENVVQLREQPPKHRWEDIAATIYGDARRWPDAQRLYDEVRGAGAAQRHWTGRGRPPSGYAGGSASVPGADAPSGETGVRSRRQPKRTSSGARATGRGRHAEPLLRLARRIEADTGKSVPTPNPDGPGTRARCLFVLRDPGATSKSGANETGILDPFLNRDPTSGRQRRYLIEAGIDPGVCLWWNASPYHLGYSGAILDVDARRGARYLSEFVTRCPDLRVVVAMGPPSQAVCRMAWQGREHTMPPLLLTWHPMTRGKGGERRVQELKDVLRQASLLIRSD
jgi:hypothetical protein